MSRELSKEIRGKAAEFIEWLQNAEEDSDEEEEDEEDDADGVVEVCVNFVHQLICSAIENICLVMSSECS